MADWDGKSAILELPLVAAIAAVLGALCSRTHRARHRAPWPQTPSPAPRARVPRSRSSFSSQSHQQHIPEAKLVLAGTPLRNARLVRQINRTLADFALAEGHLSSESRRSLAQSFRAPTPLRFQFPPQEPNSAASKTPNVRAQRRRVSEAMVPCVRMVERCYCCRCPSSRGL